MNERNYIYASKYKTSFSAALKTGDGQIMEYGQAMVSTETRSVDFSADFVPLFKMGTPLEIVRLFDNREIHSFSGAVYLSSERLLRITSVKDCLLEGSERAYLFPVETEATVQVIVDEPIVEPVKKRRPFRRKQSDQTETNIYPVTVIGIAIDAVEFTTMVKLPNTQQITLTMESPFPLEDIPLEVKRVLQFGPGGENYSCQMLSLPKPLCRKWEELIKEMNQKTNKFF